MANFFFKLMYVLSNISPIFFILFIIFLTKQEWLSALVFLFLTLSISFIFYRLFSYGEKNCGNTGIRITRVSVADNLTSTYILSCLSSSLSFIDGVDFYMCILFSIFVILILSSMNAATPNPVLSLKKYHFYYVDTKQGVSYVLISKKTEITDKSQVQFVKKVFKYLLIDAEENNV